MEHTSHALHTFKAARLAAARELTRVTDDELRAAADGLALDRTIDLLDLAPSPERYPTERHELAEFLMDRMTREPMEDDPLAWVIMRTGDLALMRAAVAFLVRQAAIDRIAVAKHEAQSGEKRSAAVTPIGGDDEADDLEAAEEE